MYNQREVDSRRLRFFRFSGRWVFKPFLLDADIDAEVVAALGSYIDSNAVSHSIVM